MTDSQTMEGRISYHTATDPGWFMPATSSIPDEYYAYADPAQEVCCEYFEHEDLVFIIPPDDRECFYIKKEDLPEDVELADGKVVLWNTILKDMLKTQLGKTVDADKSMPTFYTTDTIADDGTTIMTTFVVSENDIVLE